MSEKILVPALGESITEATVAKWIKKVGDTVEADEAIVELETDKVNLEVPSPIDGVLSEINSKDGDTVEVGAMLGLISINISKKLEEKKIEKIQTEKTESEVINLKNKKKEPKIFKYKSKDIEPLVLEEKPLILTDEVKESEMNNVNKNSEIHSPAVRKIVAENKIDLEKIRGSGKDGRILKGDLISMMGVNPQPSERKIKYGQEERINPHFNFG